MLLGQCVLGSFVGNVFSLLCQMILLILVFFYGLLFFVTFLEHGLFKSIVFSNGFVYVFLNMCVSPTGPLGPRWVVVVVVVVVIIIVIVVVLLSILICYHYHYYCYY